MDFKAENLFRWSWVRPEIGFDADFLVLSVVDGALPPGGKGGGKGLTGAAVLGQPVDMRSTPHLNRMRITAPAL